MLFTMDHLTFAGLKAMLQGGLPGEAAHKTMLPSGRKLRFEEAELLHAKKSAVLILLFPHENTVKVCLTLRSAKMKHHAGQISFPGGKIEDADRSVFDAALRETAEEIGIHSERVRQVGNLSEIHLMVSNFVVYPVVAWCDQMPEFQINKYEVEQIILLSLTKFVEDKFRTTTKITLQSGDSIEVPCFYIENYMVWGATAMMLAELAMVIAPHFHQDRAKHSRNDGSGPTHD